MGEFKASYQDTNMASTEHIDTSRIASQLKSGYNHNVSAKWHARSALTKSMFIYPVFVSSNEDDEISMPGLPNQKIWGQSKLLNYLESLVSKGLEAILVFGSLSPHEVRDNRGTMADDPNGPVRKAIPRIRARFPELYIVADVSLTEYTNHGHSNILWQDGRVDNASSVERISDVALSYAKAGAHCVAPSDMSDGRIRAIKSKLIRSRLESDVAVMAYSAKYSSCLYGPFYNSVSESPTSGDRNRYLLPPPARGLAKKALNRDMAEGADMVMVKPAYADIIRDAAEMCNVPVTAYQVSGEFSMIHAAANAGIFDLRTGATEASEVIVRAGATVIISYFTPEFLDWLKF